MFWSLFENQRESAQYNNHVTSQLLSYRSDMISCRYRVNGARKNLRLAHAGMVSCRCHFKPVCYRYRVNGVSGEQLSGILSVLKNVRRSEPRSSGHLEPEFSFPALENSNLGGKQRLNSGIGYQYLTFFLGWGINIGPNFWDWVVTEILAAHTPE